MRAAVPAIAAVVLATALQSAVVLAEPPPASTSDGPPPPREPGAPLEQAGAPLDEAAAALDEARAALEKVPPDRGQAREALTRARSFRGDRDAVAEAFYRLGELDEDDGTFARAPADYSACIEASPSSRWAEKAAERMAWLQARSEGNFMPLARLERVLRDPTLSNDPDALRALAADADNFPSGKVRVEARMFVAQAWLERRDRRTAALAALREVIDDPQTDPLTARLAERELVDALVTDGRTEEAAREGREHADRLEPRFLARVQRLARRRTLRWGAIGVIVTFGLLGAWALGGAARRKALPEVGRALRRVAPIALLFAAYVAGVGGLLASRYETGNASPFVVLGAALLPITLAARAWGAAGSSRRGARIGRILLCAATAIAAAFLVLDAVNPTYLDGFGL